MEFELSPVPAPKGAAVASLAELKSHPELYFEGADIVMMIMSSAFVFLMVPGIALVYSGAADQSSAITMARIPLITTAFVGFQWYLWGYTLTFSSSNGANPNGKVSWYGGNPYTNAFWDVTVQPIGSLGPKIPESVYALYQGMFACFTASIVAGGVMRKAPIGRFLIFISIWSVIVYSPVARWTWHPQGWSRMRGGMDFAGGTAVHVCSGATVAAYCTFFQLEVRGWKLRNLWNPWQKEKKEGKVIDGVPPQQIHRNESKANSPAAKQGEGNVEQEAEPEEVSKLWKERDFDLEAQHLESSENHNVTNVVLGTTLLWFGWYGFNGGSAQGANARAVSAILATHVAACAGGSVGLLFEWLLGIFPKRLGYDTSKDAPSVLGFCDGAISGLIAITPAAGYVPARTASAFGVVAAIICKLLRYYVRKRILPYDILDICAVHAGGGFVGMLLTAAFASDVVTGLDGYSRLVSATRPQRFGNQLFDVTVGFFYSFTATFFILVGMKVSAEFFRKSGRRRPNVVRDKLCAMPQHKFA